MKATPNQNRDYQDIPTTSMQITSSNHDVEVYFNRLIKSLPNKLRDEATEKGYKLSLFNEDQIAQYFVLKIPNATKQLKTAFEALMPYLIQLNRSDIQQNA